MAVERKEAFDLVGTMVTLIGPELKVGDTAPDFTVRDEGLQPVSMDKFRGKPLLISVVPSIDTSVCAIQTNNFDKEAANIGDKASFITISADPAICAKTLVWRKQCRQRTDAFRLFRYGLWHRLWHAYQRSTPRQPGGFCGR